MFIDMCVYIHRLVNTVISTLGNFILNEFWYLMFFLDLPLCRGGGGCLVPFWVLLAGAW